MNQTTKSSVEANSREDTWTNAPTHAHSKTSAILNRHVEAYTNNVKLISSDREVQDFKGIQTNWTNFTSCSKYYEDQLDHDFQEDANQTIHLQLSAHSGTNFQEVASCRFHVHPHLIDEHSIGPRGNGRQGGPHVRCGEIGDIHLNPDFLKLDGGRANDALYGTLESLLNSLANTFQHLHTEQNRMDVLSTTMSDWCEKNSIYAGWKVEGNSKRAAENILDHIESQESRGKAGQSLEQQERVASSFYQFSHSLKDTTKSGTQIKSLKRARLSILPLNNILKEDSLEPATAYLTDEQSRSTTEQQKATELVIIRAILAFMDIFEDALESPEVPLMQLDADSLVLNELADALSKGCEKSVKVVDLFSSGRNTCAGLLRFLSGGMR